MLKSIISCYISLTLFSNAASTNVLQLQAFEGVNDFEGYTLSDDTGNLTFGVNSPDPSMVSDFIIRTSSADAFGEFDVPTFGFTGNFIALEDIDSIGFDNEEGYLTLDKISGAYENLGIGFTIAAPDASDTRYDFGDILELQYRVDEVGAWQVASGTSYSGTGSGAALFLNGDPGGASVSENAVTVFADLTGVVTTTSLQVRVHFISGSQEEMAFDDIIVRGDVVPEPSSSLLVLCGGLMVAVRRRK